MKKGLNIAFFGSSLVSAYWNGAATYYRGIIRNLSALGHQVTFYEPDAFSRQQNRDMADPDWAKVVVYGAEGTDGVVQALNDAADADVIIKASGVGVFDELLEEAVPSMKRGSNQVIFWDVDAPATLDRMRENPADPFLQLVPKYDCVLTYGGGDPVVRAYESFGAAACIPIYNALDPSTHFRGDIAMQYEGDLGFLGNRLPDREARIDEFFFRAAEQLPGKSFVLGGSGWQDRPVPSNVRYVGHVFTPQHNSFNSSPLAVLNISRESMARYGFSPATRVFEAAGAGACLITDEWEGIELFLEPEVEVLVADSGDSVAALLDSLTPSRARRIGDAALRRVLSEHTYVHRAQQVDELLGAKHTLQISISESLV